MKKILRALTAWAIIGALVLSISYAPAIREAWAACSRLKVWTTEVLTSSDLNSEYNNIIDNFLSCISPLTGNLDVGSNNLLNVSNIDVETAIRDANSNELIKATATSSAVNELTLANAAASAGPTISTTGSDTDIDLNIALKGAGILNLDGALTLDQITAPSTAASEGGIYTKDKNAQPELFFREESDGGEVQLTSQGKPSALTSYIGGLKLSNDATPDEDVNITAGIARDATDTETIVLASEITKQIDATWAVGNDAGGLASGASLTADTLYAVWLILRSDTGVVDVLIDDSFSTPDFPTNYDFARLIGAVVTDSTSDIITFTQSGDYFRYMGDVVADVNDATITASTFEVGTLSVPPNCLAHIYGILSNETGTDIDNTKLFIRTNGAADAPGNDDAWSLSRHATAAGKNTGNVGMVLVDGSSQVQYAATEDDGTVTVQINTLGFDMLTRSNP